MNEYASNFKLIYFSLSCAQGHPVSGMESACEGTGLLWVVRVLQSQESVLVLDRLSPGGRAQPT